MITSEGQEESSGPGLFPPGDPTANWNVDDLGEYARFQHEGIVDGEKTLAPLYWSLGLSLRLAKRHFNYGQWSQYLAKWGISKARAARANAIYRTFADQGDVMGLSVEEAYDRRQRTQRSRIEETENETNRVTAPSDPLQDWLQDAASIADPPKS